MHAYFASQATQEPSQRLSINPDFPNHKNSTYGIFVKMIKPFVSCACPVNEHTEVEQEHRYKSLEEIQQSQLSNQKKSLHKPIKVDITLEEDKRKEGYSPS